MAHQEYNHHTPMRVPLAPSRSVSAAAVPQIRISGTADEDDCAYATAVLSAVVAKHQPAVDHPRVRISVADADGGITIVQVNLGIQKAPARIQVCGPSVTAAVDRAAARLHRQVKRFTSAWERWSWPDSDRPPLTESVQPVIARLKSFTLLAGPPCQALAYLDAMDYDVFLYVDAETGEDSVVYRSGPSAITLARQRSIHPPTLPVALPLTTHPRPAPTLTAARAAGRLRDAPRPFVFYTDPDTRRGNLLYRRYHGGLGLIAPTAPEKRQGAGLS